jgi:hypothetical protein
LVLGKDLGEAMRVVEAKVARMLCCEPWEADLLAAEGKRVPTRAIGVRVTLDCGTVAFWSFKWRTISVRYRATLQHYKSGGIICDEHGEPVMKEGTRNGALGVGDFVAQYGGRFAMLVMGAITQVESEEGRCT